MAETCLRPQSASCLQAGKLATATPDQLRQGFEELKKRSPWMASFVINGQVYGSGLNHEDDVRPAHFFRLVRNPSRILELGSCQGGGTFQLARHPRVDQVIAIEGRGFNIDKATFVKHALAANNVTFLEGDLEAFDFTPLGRFDAVYCVGLLYHLPHPWELLAKLAKVSDILYINTHYCPLSQAALTLHGYEGKKWLEFGYEDPLSGMSSWSFWPTLPALARMLLEAGFVPEILETDTCGPGQSPHGTTILAARTETLSEEDQRSALVEMQEVLSKLPATSGCAPPATVPWLRGTLSRVKRIVTRAWQVLASRP
jgi:SAM-dependent methyltransferase